MLGGTTTQSLCALFQGGTNPTITTYQFFGTTPGSGPPPQPCYVDNVAALADRLAHEMGHFLNLGHVPTSCTNSIMTNISNPASTSRGVTPAECEFADFQNLTGYEEWCLQQSDPETCTNCDYGQCNSPILLDLEGNGFRLTGLHDAVWFDIDGDGTLDLVNWVRPHSDDAFLALDRNGNGTVDSGRELFGDATILLDGTESRNGFFALAELDSPQFQGSHDGVIDSNDPIYFQLLLWQDWDADGISQPEELFALPALGVQSLGYGFRYDQSFDRHGNELSFWATAKVSNRNQTRNRDCVDAILVTH